MIIIKYDDKEIKSEVISLTKIYQELLTDHEIEESESLTMLMDGFNYYGNCLFDAGLSASQVVERQLSSFIDYLNLVYELDIEFDPDYLEVEVSE